MIVALDDERLHERSRGNTMAASQNFVTADTPMGATLVDGGATFRVWAPRAAHVYVARGDTSAYQAAPQDELVRDPSTGHWTGFVPGVVDGSTYRYYVVGTDYPYGWRC
jgi:1,4-alpha-glucan branching enzyme